MEVTAAQRTAYADDGVVVLRGLLDERWLELLATAVERNLAEPGEHAQRYTPEGQPGQYFGDYCNWDRIDGFRQVAFDSGLAGVARQLMGSDTSRFFHEHVLVKEPGTREVTPWHHDQPYYCVDGDQNVSFWIPLDPVPASCGVRFVAGSHRWGRWFVPRRFVDHVPYSGADDRFDLVPDVDAELDRHRILVTDGGAGRRHRLPLPDPARRAGHRGAVDAAAGGEPALAGRRRHLRAAPVAALSPVRTSGTSPKAARSTTTASRS